MDHTEEQLDIINAVGDIKVNAVAGSGKTTTIIAYAKALPKNRKILYLAFNKSVKLEAVKKFSESRLLNVKVETAHSLAYKQVVFKNNYKVRQTYKTHEIVSLLNLKGKGEKHEEYIIANHINKYAAFFCNSDKRSVQELNYLDVVFDAKAKVFVKTFYQYIEKKTRELLARMDEGKIEITHDFYLKKFQLSNPVLAYDYILFDEGQDASPAMLDVFLKQKATKVIVGDTHQQIYSWRFAVNSLEKVSFKSYNLSKSFRFGPEIAQLAKGVLKWKNHLEDPKPFLISGAGTSKAIQTKAVIARTNLGLLLKAIEYVTEKRKVQRIYFEGNINSYTYADEGASLYDVLHLYNKQRHRIKDKLIKDMRDVEELEDYIKKTEDTQLGMMVEIVKEYGNEIPKILKILKNKHVENNEKEKADLIFSTVHRSKGMEYDAIQIVNDFITEEKIRKATLDNKEEIIFPKLNEEINLLYVAATRAKNIVYIPVDLMPKELTASAHIQVIKTDANDDKNKPSTERTIKNEAATGAGDEKVYSFEEVRIKFKDAYKPWTKELDDELTVMFCEGGKVKNLELKELYDI